MLAARNTLTLEFLCGFGDVRVDFLAQIDVALLAAEPSEEPRQKDAKRRHGRPPSILKNLATIPVACCQAASSLFRCFRPALVSA